MALVDGLHKKGVYHMDLGLDQFVLGGRGTIEAMLHRGPNVQLFLVDFGAARLAKGLQDSQDPEGFIAGAGSEHVLPGAMGRKHSRDPFTVSGPRDLGAVWHPCLTSGKDTDRGVLGCL